mmetsp:Transcript_24005/g.63380  ORF Transcript_24005/g.63380 Transcript_24005/m.63380 type:complete len:539 (+) Transcript_24005:133-1749(+)
MQANSLVGAGLPVRPRPKLRNCTIAATGHDHTATRKRGRRVARLDAARLERVQRHVVLLRKRPRRDGATQRGAEEDAHRLGGLRLKRLAAAHAAVRAAAVGGDVDLQLGGDRRVRLQAPPRVVVVLEVQDIGRVGGLGGHAAVPRIERLGDVRRLELGAGEEGVAIGEERADGELLGARGDVGHLRLDGVGRLQVAELRALQPGPEAVVLDGRALRRLAQQLRFVRRLEIPPPDPRRLEPRRREALGGRVLHVHRLEARAERGLLAGLHGVRDGVGEHVPQVERPLRQARVARHLEQLLDALRRRLRLRQQAVDRVHRRGNLAEAAGRVAVEREADGTVERVEAHARLHRRARRDRRRHRVRVARAQPRRERTRVGAAIGDDGAREALVRLDVGDELSHVGQALLHRQVFQARRRRVLRRHRAAEEAVLERDAQPAEPRHPGGDGRREALRRLAGHAEEDGRVLAPRPTLRAHPVPDAVRPAIRRGEVVERHTEGVRDLVVVGGEEVEVEADVRPLVQHVRLQMRRHERDVMGQPRRR